MIYYNYSPYFHPPLKHYPNMQSTNATHNKNYTKPSSMNHTHVTNSSEKNIQNRFQQKSCADMTNLHPKKNNFAQEEDFRKITDSKDEAIFEILGIKLYFDDILLLCLIFFLYTEGVQDQYLFIALILLLLS